jgi:hypothetical protein
MRIRNVFTLRHAAHLQMLAPLGDRRVARRAARQNTMLLATPAEQLRAGLPALVEVTQRCKSGES